MESQDISTLVPLQFRGPPLLRTIGSLDGSFAPQKSRPPEKNETDYMEEVLVRFGKDLLSEFLSSKMLSFCTSQGWTDAEKINLVRETTDDFRKYLHGWIRIFINSPAKEEINELSEFSFPAPLKPPSPGVPIPKYEYKSPIILIEDSVSKKGPTVSKSWQGHLPVGKKNVHEAVIRTEGFIPPLPSQPSPQPAAPLNSLPPGSITYKNTNVFNYFINQTFSQQAPAALSASQPSTTSLSSSLRDDDNPHLYITTSRSYQSNNICKMGFHSGDEKKLLTRYVTSVPEIIILFFMPHPQARQIERSLKEKLKEKRIASTTSGRKIEWIQMTPSLLLKEVVSYMLKFDEQTSPLPVK